MNFGIVMNILRMVNGLPFLFSGNSKAKLHNITEWIKSFSGSDDLDSVLKKIESNPKYRERMASRLNKAFKKYNKCKLAMRDMENARTRDLELRKINKSNKRANFLLGFAVFGILASFVLMFLLKENSGLTILFGNIIKTCSLILTDVSILEFGNNIYRCR